MNEAQPSVDSSSAPPNSRTELYFCFYGLSIVVLVVSLSLTLFVKRLSFNLRSQLDTLKAQITQYDQNQVFQHNKVEIQNLIRDVALQTPLHPDAREILARYNYRVETPLPASAAAPAAK